ncbi:MAG TPA: hypothetical protein VF669_12430 [Tepidisphaeraceae bacterium]|jgi:hypothetical protein
MTPQETIRALLTEAGQAADEQERAQARIAARIAWVHEAMDALLAAHKKVNDAWDRIFEALPEDMDDEEVDQIPPPPEQAELDAILAEIEAVRDHDRWPRHLHWKNL